VPRIAQGLGQWTGQIAASEMAADVGQVVILTVGSTWSAEYELDAHISAARVAGVPDGAIDAIVQRRAPAGLSEPGAVAHRLAVNLLTEHTVSDELCQEATTAFGEAGLIAILCLIGHYQTISSILSASRSPCRSAQRGGV